ncbi:MAG: protein kinase [Pirellula sp.]
MSDHFPSEVIQRALQGELPPEQESAFHAHMESCPACATAMERIAGAEQIGCEISDLLQADEIGDLVPGRDEYSMTDFIVENLEPSDSPEALGQLGGYDILEVIGRGGMGVVLKGFDRELKRLVAIKALAPHLAHTPFARKRFAREGQAAAAVVNLHVIAIHQVQPNGRLPFLVMPLLTGESLAHRLKASGTMAVKEILRIGMQAADGLAAAHAQGLIHRDVKPANILLEKGVERAVLTDFGLARAADDVSITRQGFIAGTPEYMSPEQARGEALDGRSDLFSLGCVLYEMATGVSPFRTDSTLATLRRIVEDQPSAMASLVPELPPWFCNIVERLLSKDPAQRFDSASEVNQVLAGCLAHLQQPTSVPLPILNGAKDQMRTVFSVDAWFFVVRILGRTLSTLFSGGGIVKGWPPVIWPKPPLPYSPIWPLTVIPIWNFCFLTILHTMFDVMSLHPLASVDRVNKITIVLGCTLTSWCMGLIAAQFSVAVTPSRMLRPLMSLWILVLPYLLAKQVSHLIADWYGQTFSLVPIPLSNETGTYFFIAMLSAIIYSFVIRRELSLPEPTTLGVQILRDVDSGEFRRL